MPGADHQDSLSSCATIKGMRRIDISGQRFNFLTALRRVGATKDKGQNSLWECRCECGNKKVLQIGSLKNGTTKSCGCMKPKLISASRTTHGITNTDIFRIWQGIRTRCENPRSKSFRRYGGRGIRLCEQWHDVTAFAADMGERPPGMSVERIDNDGNYSPENCRWATRREQQNNIRTNTKLTYRGARRTVAEWSRELEIPAYLIYARYKRGWRTDEIFGCGKDI